MEQSKDFDQRLGTVLNLAFQHSKNLDSTFKVRYAFIKKKKYSNIFLLQIVI